ncbi:T3SS effector HopA1 family protein [Streptomyces sp. NPDC006385]|uniref:T3SS effector HopA1 family protein n=1 Tax=Streptomyces sp. NPDC006385 TaxID=3156761 RepID=UPI0033B04A93
MFDQKLRVAAQIVAVAESVTVSADGLKAEVAGEVIEADNPTSLAQQIGDTLYEIVHAGRDKRTDSIQRSLRDPAFESVLLDATSNRTTTAPARYLTGDEETAIVVLDGLRVRVPTSSIAERSGEMATVTLPCARPGVSVGFFLATSGKVPYRSAGHVLRLYGRLDSADVAAPVWRQLVDFLEDAGVPWQAKISSSKSGYPRNDAVVVYLPRPSWRVARACAAMLEATGLTGEGTSAFAHPITRSVSCAFEPDDQRANYRGMSFGQHRATVLGEALVRHATLPEEESVPVADRVYQAFIDAGIDPSQPARNLSSPVVDVLSPS